MIFVHVIPDINASVERYRVPGRRVNGGIVENLRLAALADNSACGYHEPCRHWPGSRFIRREAKFFIKR